MKSSTSSTTLPPQVEFRDNDVIPGHYLINITIFFIIFIAISLTVTLILKNKFPNAFSKTRKKSDFLAKTKTQRLSANTNLHIITYNESSILIVESTNHVNMQIISSNNEQDIDKHSTAFSSETPDGR